MAVTTRGTRVRRPTPGKALKATSKSLGKAKAPRAKIVTRKAVTSFPHYLIPSSRTVSRNVVLEIPLSN